MAGERYGEDSVDLITYLQIIIKHKWIIVVGTLLFLFLGLFLKWRQPIINSFRAKSAVMILPPKIKSEILPQFPLEVYGTLAQAQDIKESIIDTLLRRNSNQEISILDLAGSMEVEVGAGADGALNLLEFTVTSRDTNKMPPVLITNVWADVFVKKNQGLTSNEAIGSYEYINEQYQLAKTNLDSVSDALTQLDNESNLGNLKAEFTLKKGRLDNFLQQQVNLNFQLEDAEEALLEHEKFIQACETIDGQWIGDLAFTNSSMSMPHYLDQNQRILRQAIIHARDEYAQILDDIEGFHAANDLEVEQLILSSKQNVFARSLNDLQNIQVDAEATAKTIKETTPDELMNQTVVSFSSPEQWREWASLKLQYNLFEPRRLFLDQDIPRLRVEIDSLKNKIDEQQELLKNLNEILDRRQHNYQLYKPLYLDKKKQVSTYRKIVQDFKLQIDRNNRKIQPLKEDVKNLAKSISELERQRNLLVRDRDLYQTTFDKFAKLHEDARIAKARQPEDVKVVEKAVIPVRVPPNSQPLSPIFIAGVGLLISIFATFLIDFIQKARLQMSE